ncbi:NAD-dependent epimerase/dehydratase family protein [Chryseosolibacter indicus]|uniref:NAD-dependent epimerase/dehydratase family protein n=1 Tax=Chryseosolibacter indicus TaxID=2782351 RepID=A0ABS5VTT1_9BACT|nr:NAD-dependent epimerase/dehydratase family protein [Chryseosolibacter indicus]MBT1704294.1 NAD-dependent epimerase/dehydratase family protein [Chryseosolibacter indicus]
MSKIKVIITGATGMVGEGVLHECLNHPRTESVLIINRKPYSKQHPKLKEIIHADFYDLSTIESQLSGYDACFFCLGVSSVGMSKEEYFKTTYTLTMNVAKTLSRLNPHMTFCYISGAGTDNTEKSMLHWARVKGRTENDLMTLPFRDVYAVRPGFLKATEGLSNTNPLYKYVNWIFPIGKALYPDGFCSLKELGLAMITLAIKGYPKKVIEVKNIVQLAKIPV